MEKQKNTVSRFKKRQYNLTSVLRKKNIVVKTKSKTIIVLHDFDFTKVKQVRMLVGEYNYVIQLSI